MTNLLAGQTLFEMRGEKKYVTYRIVHIYLDNADAVLIESDGTDSELFTKPVHTLLGLIERGQWGVLAQEPKGWRWLETLDVDALEADPARQRQIAIRDKRFEIIEELLKLGEDLFIKKRRAKAIKELCKRRQLHHSTVYRALRLWWQGGCKNNALLPPYGNCGHCGRGRYAGRRKARPTGRSRGRPPRNAALRGQRPNIDPDLVKRMTAGYEKCAKEYRKISWPKAYRYTLTEKFADGYKFEEQPTGYFDEKGKEIIRLVRFPVFNHPENLPSQRQFNHHVGKALDLPKLARTLVGERNFRKDHSPRSGDASSMAAAPGDFYQIDSTIADVYLVSSDGKRVIGRPVLYLVTDVFSHLIVGFYVGLEHSSYLAAILALENAAIDKVEFCRQLGVNIKLGDWPSFGVPRHLVADRGELGKENGRRLAKDIGIGLDVLPAYRPDLKPIVESLFQSANIGYIHWLQGKTSPRKERCQPTADKKATISLAAFRRLTVWWILEANKRQLKHHPKRREIINDGIRPTALNLFTWGQEKYGKLCRHFTRDELMMRMLPKAKARITQQGLEFRDFYYEPAPKKADALKIEASFTAAPGLRRDFMRQVVFHPRYVDRVHVLPGDAFEDVEAWQLTSRHQPNLGLSWDEVDELEDYANLLNDGAATSTLLDLIRTDARIDGEVRAEIKRTRGARRGGNPRTDRQSVRENRKAAQAEDKPHDPLFQIPDTLTNADPKSAESTEEYIGPAVDLALFSNSSGK